MSRECINTLSRCRITALDPPTSHEQRFHASRDDGSTSLAQLQDLKFGRVQHDLEAGNFSCHDCAYEPTWTTDGLVRMPVSRVRRPAAPDHHEHGRTTQPGSRLAQMPALQDLEVNLRPDHYYASSWRATRSPSVVLHVHQQTWPTSRKVWRC
jgi:hypothetical protein